MPTKQLSFPQNLIAKLHLSIKDLKILESSGENSQTVKYLLRARLHPT